MVTKTPRFKPTRIFVHLEDGGAALPVECTPALWRETGSGTRRYDRLVGVLHFEEEADLHPTMWEMHPSADEFLFLVSGAVRLILQEETSERSIELGAGQATIVPRGVWHRLLMRRPGDLLFINSRTGMQHRPVEPGPPRQASEHARGRSGTQRGGFDRKRHDAPRRRPPHAISGWLRYVSGQPPVNLRDRRSG